MATSLCQNHALVLVVQRVDSTIQLINLYPVDSVIEIYPMDSAIQL